MRIAACLLLAIPALHPPSGIRLGPDGTIYTVDFIEGRVLIVAPDGVVRAMPGTEKLERPHILAVDSKGNAFVANDGDLKIRKVTPGGDMLHVAGSGKSGHDDGPALEATFTDLQGGMDIDAAGNLYVTDGDRIRKITPDGVVSTVAAEFESLHYGDLAVGSDGTIYVADPREKHVWRIAGEERALIADAANFEFPCAVAVGADGVVYVADSATGRILKVSADGTVARIGRHVEFSNPSGLAFNPQTGILYVMDDADRSARPRRTEFARMPRITMLKPDGTAEILVDRGGYNPKISDSKVPVIAGGIVMGLAILAVGTFLWVNRRRLTN